MESMQLATCCFIGIEISIIGYCMNSRLYAVLEPEECYIITEGTARGNYVTFQRFL